ncbi:cytochrome c peroxidase [Thalassotalea fonticola]|uniref:Cytochrome c peroxidase n=1 Tax=Thalassotalea fonticola TaxID=3065649 RepID=A0ABZ0GQS7_9GAMM|nr:cytochrome c peroxidase [Colwelliaceae bacterium S1-1]
MNKLIVLCFSIIFTFSYSVTAGENLKPHSGSEFSLTAKCPPSFELIENGTCKLRNMYQFYNSVQGRGLGGTQTSLPKHRDGFTPAQIDLGRYLFFDPALSKDNSISCASCHQPEKGFSDDLDRSIGITGEKVGRSAPTLWNVAFLDKFFWDGRADTLEEQAVGPLFDSKEMGNTPENLLNTLNAIPTYIEMFKVAYPQNGIITVANISESLAAFQSSLISLNSRYDQYAHGYHEALNKNEIKGLNIFRSFVARCAECHQPPLFTNNQIAVIGTPDPIGMPFDIGAEKTFNNKKNRGGFKVPTLRNIAKTAPYMHSGGLKDLREATEFYNKGRGHAVPEDEDLLIHWHIWEPELQDEEIDLIVEFLQTLTDESLTPQLPNSLPSGLPVIDAAYAKNQIQKQQKQQQNINTESGDEDE